MSNSNNLHTIVEDKDQKTNKNSDFFKSKIVNEVTRKDIEKSININDSHGTEAYYSNRYGWTLRKIIY